MLYLRPEQLTKQLKNKINYIYLLNGIDPLLLQESRNKILETAKNYGFKENYNFSLNKTTNFNNIFNICKTFHLFNDKKILFFTLANNQINNILDKKIPILISLIDENLLFIIHINKLTDYIQNSIWFKTLHKKSILVNCNTPKYNNLSNWILNRAKKMNILLNYNICQIICEYYEDNLLGINELLKNLKCTHYNNDITISQIKNIIYELIYFTPSHWINTLLSGNYKLSYYILQKLKLENIDPVILLRKLQYEVILLVILKQKIKKKITPLILLKEYKIWQNKHQILLIKALKRLHFNQLVKAIKIMIQLELAIKQNIIYDTWNTFEILTFLLCK